MDCYHDLTYYCTEGYRLVFVTDNYSISLSANGVIKESKEDLHEGEGEWLQNAVADVGDAEPPFVRYEATLFIGERILSVTENNGKYTVQFDDFTLTVIGCKNKDIVVDIYNKGRLRFCTVSGCDRHLKRNCPHCNGEGEILMDFVSDYIVRCKNCKKSTYGQMMLIDAIDDWNCGYVECDLSDIKIAMR